jgi:hypothetical protein
VAKVYPRSPHSQRASFACHALRGYCNTGRTRSQQGPVGDVQIIHGWRRLLTIRHERKYDRGYEYEYICRNARGIRTQPPVQCPASERERRTRGLRPSFTRARCSDAACEFAFTSSRAQSAFVEESRQELARFTGHRVLDRVAAARSPVACPHRTTERSVPALVHRRHRRRLPRFLLQDVRRHPWTRPEGPRGAVLFRAKNQQQVRGMHPPPHATVAESEFQNKLSFRLSRCGKSAKSNSILLRTRQTFKANACI